MRRLVQHETDAAGQRLLHAAFEGFGWVVNSIENDYGADWRLAIEPLLYIERSPAAWAKALAIVRRRSM